MHRLQLQIELAANAAARCSENARTFAAWRRSGGLTRCSGKGLVCQPGHKETPVAARDRAVHLLLSHRGAWSRITASDEVLRAMEIGRQQPAMVNSTAAGKHGPTVPAKLLTLARTSPSAGLGFQWVLVDQGGGHSD